MSEWPHLSLQVPSKVSHRKIPLRVRSATTVGRLASFASRRLTGGAGEVIGGTLAQRIHPGLLAELANGRVLACVSATNGKTTTTAMLTAALGGEMSPISNTGGANMTAGLISTLMSAPGRPAVLEVDEMYLGLVLRALKPRVVLLLNLSRDQLDRSAETRKVAAGWRQALATSSGSSIVVANCDDPLVVWAAQGGQQVVWVSAGQHWTADAQTCPACGGLLTRAVMSGGEALNPGDALSPGEAVDSSSGDWACGRCGFARPQPQAALAGDDLLTEGGARLPIATDLPGRANRANAVMATVAAGQLGVPASTALRRIATIVEVAGRYRVQQIGGVKCRLMLAKNPASWLEVLNVLEGQPQQPLVICIGALAVDGRDTSWLYDVTFEQLRAHQVTVAGRRGADLSLRLTYAEVPHHLLSDVETAVQVAFSTNLGRRDVTINVIGDYSSFHAIERMRPAAGSTARADLG